MPTSTIDLSLPNGDLIPIEERDEREVTEIDGVRIAPIGVKVGNPAFDVTPHKYVTGIVTENGIAYPPFEISSEEGGEGLIMRNAERECRSPGMNDGALHSAFRILNSTFLFLVRSIV